MLILLIFSVILGAVVAGLTGIGFLFWIVSIFVFICGLPGALIGGFIHSENEYIQDRADYREMMRQIAEDDRSFEYEVHEDERFERYLDKFEDISINSVTYNDNRQIHLHNVSTNEHKIRK